MQRFQSIWKTMYTIVPAQTMQCKFNYGHPGILSITIIYFRGSFVHISIQLGPVTWYLDPLVQILLKYADRLWNIKTPAANAFWGTKMSGIKKHCSDGSTSYRIDIRAATKTRFGGITAGSSSSDQDKKRRPRRGLEDTTAGSSSSDQDEIWRTSQQDHRAAIRE